MDEQVVLYSNSKGVNRLCAGVPPRLMEFNKLNYMWEKLGLNKFDLENCSPQWIEDMISVGVGLEKYKNNSKANDVPSTGRGFKNKQVEKLL